MTVGTNPSGAASVTSGRLGALLDKLVAVDLDLEPFSRVNGSAARIVASADDIADACDTLHSAIADLRNFIHQLDGMTNLQRAPSRKI